MVNLINYGPTSLIFFDIPLLYYYTNLNSSVICCLSSGGTYFFLVVALSTSTSVSSFGNLLLDFQKHFLFYLQFFILSHQLLLLFFELFFLKQFLLRLLQIFQQYQQVFDCIYYLNVYPCSQQKINVHILLHILCLQIHLNILVYT